jgi:hypothetical protein
MSNIEVLILRSYILVILYIVFCYAECVHVQQYYT